VATKRTNNDDDSPELTEAERLRDERAAAASRGDDQAVKELDEKIRNLDTDG
jgi:hypothetical protein